MNYLASTTYTTVIYAAFYCLELHSLVASSGSFCLYSDMPVGFIYALLGSVSVGLLYNLLDKQ